MTHANRISSYCRAGSLVPNRTSGEELSGTSSMPAALA